MKRNAKQRNAISGVNRRRQGRRAAATFGQTWALVLAGGEGSRLRELTTVAGGTSVPKQFCSLVDGRTLLEDAIDRAHGVTARERICTIVSQHHRQWWSSVLNDAPRENVIVQPRGRGTGVGILFSVLHIAARDPFARLVIFPADHHVSREDVLHASLLDALRAVAAGEDAPVLLGLSPDRIDTELGYIIPDSAIETRSVRAVTQFVEKPDRDLARSSIAGGALWSTSIIVTAVSSLVRLFLQRYAVLTREMQAIVNAAINETTPGAGWQSLVAMYERLPAIDFSKDVLQLQPQALRVLSVPECGWSDLGSPTRLAETLRLLPSQNRATVAAPFVDLAAQHALYERQLRALHPN